MKVLDVDRRFGRLLATVIEDISRPVQQLILPLLDLVRVHLELLGQLCRACGTSSPLIAASAALALKAGLWLRLGRLLMASPVHGIMPLSGRNSTYPGCPVFPSHFSNGG